MNRISSAIATFIAMTAGLLALIWLLFPGVVPGLPDFGALLLSWVTLLAVFALILGVFNLLRVHLARLPRNLYSLALVIGLLGTVAIGLSDGLALTSGGLDNLFTYILAPLERGVAAMMAFILLFAGFRMLRQNRSLWSVLFWLAAVVMLLLSLPIAGFENLFPTLRTLLDTLVVNSGARGILIGSALATITIGIRLLLGMDRPYNK